MVGNYFALADGVDIASWTAALTGLAEWGLSEESALAVTPLVEGVAEGVLYGGCLSMLAASLGTPYEIRTDGAILFIEDVATKPFQIDRMLMQLKLAGKFNGVRGIIFGEMLDCHQNKEQDYTLEEVMLRVVGDLGVPVAYGLRSGHVSRQNVTLPLGVRVSLKAQSHSVELQFLEPATLADR
jgi:muramoyltetrapeptide carboxypeptidase